MVNTEKEFGKLSRKQLRELYTQIYKIPGEKEDIIRFVGEENSKFIEVFKLMPPWCHYYELEFTQLALFAISCFGFLDTFKRFASTPDPNQSFLDFLSSDADIDIPDDELTPEFIAVCLSLLFALIGNFESHGAFHKPLSQLIKEAAEGNDEALFNAVLIDRTVVGVDAINKRIAFAHLIQDESFMNKLAKAITKTRPRRPKREYDDLRYMIEVLDQACGLENLTYEKIYDLLVGDLELYPSGQLKDAFGAFSEILKQRNKAVGKVK